MSSKACPLSERHGPSRMNKVYWWLKECQSAECEQKRAKTLNDNAGKHERDGRRLRGRHYREQPGQTTFFITLYSFEKKIRLVSRELTFYIFLRTHKKRRRSLSVGTASIGYAFVFTFSWLFFVFLLWRWSFQPSSCSRWSLWRRLSGLRPHS